MTAPAPGCTFATQADLDEAALEQWRAKRERFGEPYKPTDLCDELRKAAHRYPELAWLLRESARQIEVADDERRERRLK